VSGSSVATAVTIGKVALPEMRRLGYAAGLSTGAIAAGGTLGFLIPPSTGFVIYAILTEESIGRLFMAGILPGLLMTALFIVIASLERPPTTGNRAEWWLASRALMKCRCCAFRTSPADRRFGAFPTPPIWRALR
jgi:TRAP-type C4-dicarboxylate transport system permease large subunit